MLIVVTTNWLEQVILLYGNTKVVNIAATLTLSEVF